MKKNLILVLFLSLGFINGTEYKRQKITLQEITLVSPVINLHAYKKLERVDLKPIEYTVSKDEWYPFDLKYNYDTIPYTEKELNWMTDILTRESNSSHTQQRIIDQYLVVICALRRIQDKPKINSIRDLVKKDHLFSYPKKRKRTEHWKENKEIVRNVMRCKIPYFVPYLPHGTFYYWNSRIDTNKSQKRRLEEKCVMVASTTKNHHYFSNLEYIKDYEKRYLFDFIEQNGLNPVERYPKYISCGNVAKLQL